MKCGLSPANEQVLTTSRALASATENGPQGTYRKCKAVAAWGRRAGLLPALSLQANWGAQFPLATWAVTAPALQIL